MSIEQIEARRAHAFQAKAALELVAPIIQALRDEYRDAQMKAAINEPWAPDKIIKLSVAQRVINTVEDQLKVAITDGEIAGKEKSRAEQIAKLPEAKRKWIGA